jgi:hypothetical protein
MLASKSSSLSPVSNAILWRECLVVAIFLAALGALVGWWSFVHGYILYFGDAEAHLNIARRIVDSRTPGLEQIGTVWLPLPHLLMLPFVGSTTLWQTGLAGTIPSVLCFSLGGTLLFAATRMLFKSRAAAVAAVLLFTLNPNVLYMQTAPMTEIVFFAALLGLLFCTVRYGTQPSTMLIVGAGAFSIACSLTRYEGWFPIPFVALYFLRTGGFRAAALFSALAGLGPLSWLAHNRWYYGNPLEFYNGPYSAQAINRNARYPGFGDWSTAFLYYRTAARACAGPLLFWTGLVGLALAFFQGIRWAILLLLLPPLFYVFSIHSSYTPIHLPELPPHGYYNTRYGLAILPLAALGAAALVSFAPRRVQGLTTVLLVILCSGPTLLAFNPEQWICWKESQVNSIARRNWTEQAAGLLRSEYRPGDGILLSFGDATGILRTAGIPLREALHEGNGPQALATLYRPDLFLWEEWVIGRQGDSVWNMMEKALPQGLPYRRVKIIEVPGAPSLHIFRRSRVAPHLP